MPKCLVFILSVCVQVFKTPCSWKLRVEHINSCVKSTPSLLCPTGFKKVSCVVSKKFPGLKHLTFGANFNQSNLVVLDDRWTWPEVLVKTFWSNCAFPEVAMILGPEVLSHLGHFEWRFGGFPVTSRGSSDLSKFRFGACAAAQKFGNVGLRRRIWGFGC